MWHKALVSKLPSYGFYFCICHFIFNFTSDRSNAAVVDNYRFFPKSINSGVPQGTRSYHTLFPFFISDLLDQTSCLVHSYANDTSLRFSTSFQTRPTLEQVNSSHKDATGLLISLRFLIGSEKTSMSHKLIFSIYQFDTIFHPLFFNDIQAPPVFFNEHSQSLIYSKSKLETACLISR